MINEIIYLIIIIFSLFSYIALYKKLKNKYFDPRSLARNLGGIFLFAILIRPNLFFKKRRLLQGYLIYILHIISLFLATYLLIKLIGVI